MNSLRIVFMGTPDFSVPSLKALYHENFVIQAVITQPDKERGRGKKVSFSAVKECALELGLPILQPLTMRNDKIIEQLRNLHPDVIIVIAYGKILPPEVLAIPTYGCLNVHGSLLPAYRGAAPIQHAIYDGIKESGVTIMLLDEGMDTGKILKECRITLDPKETTGSLFEKLSIIGSQTLIEVVKDLGKYEREAIPQNDQEATYTEKITKDMACINWQENASQIERLIRTLDPSPGAYTLINGKRLKIWAANVVPGSNKKPGAIIEVTKKSFTIQTGEDALCILEVQPESRKRVSSAQFLQGTMLDVGMQL